MHAIVCIMVLLFLFVGCGGDDPVAPVDLFCVANEIEMLAGDFVMGAPVSEIGYEDDQVQHNVILTKDFFISETEVTNEQYADLAQWAFDNGYCTSVNSQLLDNLDDSIQTLIFYGINGSELSFSDGEFIVATGKENYPVAGVNWYAAVAYCDWLSIKEGYTRAYSHSTWECNENAPYLAHGYRLPTEAEWEYASRAGSNTAFSNGSLTQGGSGVDPVLSEIGWYCGNAENLSHPVGELIANSWGLYDMHGNLWEWCNDWYGSYDGDATDPIGGAPENGHVIRGGSFELCALYCTSSKRMHVSSINYSGSHIGFRFARSAE
jgi:formylglycine-generating enzyme required for sulfatase activity